MTEIERRRVTIDGAHWSWPAEVHPVLRQVLSRRNLGSPAELDLHLRHLAPVGRFGALPAAVELLLGHRHGHVVVVGDFDADGATSTALVVLALRNLGFAEVSYFIPDRFELGYGLSPEAVTRIERLGPTLIVTVDNGVSSTDGVAAARKAGIDVLITDHHLAPAQLPDANVIVNPNLPGDLFPGKQLAGVGVAFYLMAALGKELGRGSLAAEYLDLVALGTIADLVRLDHGNRILVDQGVRRLRAGRCRPGLRALCEVADVDRATAGASVLGFQLSPRLNAAGRLEDMTLGVRCLLTDSLAEARVLAARLDELNRKRRKLEARMKAEAFELVERSVVLAEGELGAIICLQRDDWHEGIVGLIAARLKDCYQRPAFAFAPTEGGGLKGSARSIAGFHIRDALAAIDAKYPGLIARFGGHAMAAGLSIARRDFAAFVEAIEAVTEAWVDSDALTTKILTDGELEPSQLSVSTASLLRESGPWGQGFPEPRFDGCFELLDFRVLKSAHLKMTLRPLRDDSTIDAIAFNRPASEWPRGAQLRIAYRLDVNDYSPTPRLQLIVEHMSELSG